MDKLIHGPSADQNNPDVSEATKSNDAVASDYYPLDQNNLLSDFKTLLTKPRYFFEFFSSPKRINHVVWAKVILVYLALAALNSMISFSSHSSPVFWTTKIDGFDPRMQSAMSQIFAVLGSVFGQVMVAAVPFLALITTALTATGILVCLRIVGAKNSTLSWAGIFCVLIAAQWTTIFGFIPGIGTTLVGLIPFIFSIIGLAQISRLSKLRTFFAAFLLPAILASVAVALIGIAMITLIGSVLH